MNERTKALFDKALDQAVPETWTTLSHEQMMKLSSVFAELIVRECGRVYIQNQQDGVMTLTQDLLQHFGVEQ